jgi:hypothetical protein
MLERASGILILYLKYMLWMDLDSSSVITINEDDRCGEVASGNSIVSCLKNKVDLQFFTNTLLKVAGVRTSLYSQHGITS